MLSSFWNLLTAPTLPRISLGISATHLAIVELQKRSGNLIPKKAGVQTLPEGLVRASLTEPNITRESEFIEQMRTVADKAGLGRKLSLSVTLPEGSARSVVVTLDHKPATREELMQMLDWKIGRSINAKMSEMRISHQQLNDEGTQPRWLVSAVQEQVIAQYERLITQLGWHAGAIVPQHLGEAQWLIRSKVEENEDQVLVSLNQQGFVVVIVRGQEPLLVREVTCSPTEREDELFRLMVFYRDRLNPLQPLKRVLIIGEATEQTTLSQAIAAALEYNPQKLLPLTLGLNLESSLPFNWVAAATGLATLAF